MSPAVSSSEPLTIVICVDHADVTGGQAKVAFDSARGLKAAGHRPIVFAAAGPVAPELAESGVELVCLGQTDLLGNPSQFKAALQGIWNVKAERGLGELLATLPADRTIVHVHGWAKALSGSIARPIKASGLPAIYTMHEYFLFCPNGGFYDYRAGEVCHRQPLSAACWATNCDSRSYPRKIWRGVRLTITQAVLGLRDVFSDFICISALQREIVQPFLPAGARVHSVANPIAAEKLGPKSDPTAGDFVFVGRLSPEKGPAVFADAARIAGIAPIFVGDGPMADQLRDRYPEARILGWQRPEAARAAMRNARALVFPSLWYEGQPLTVLESLAMGTPVIVSDVCAGREAVKDGVTGAWFRSDDSVDLAKILKAFSDDTRIAALSRAAYDAYWRDPPTLDAHVGRIEAIYREMIARSRPQVPASQAGFAEASH
jgi:glycosyltransferase involved in cell wall biosynthesis